MDEEKIEEELDPVQQKRQKTAEIVGVIAEVLTSAAVGVVVKNVLDAFLPDYTQYGKIGKLIKGITVAGAAGVSGAAVGKYYKDQVLSAAYVMNIIRGIRKKAKETVADSADDKTEQSFA